MKYIHNMKTSKKISKNNFVETNMSDIISIMILVILIVSLAGCTEKYNDPNAGTGEDTQTTNDTVDQAAQTPNECSSNIDCARLYADNPKINIDACNIPTCTSGKCSVFRKPNCCGNGVAENIEDG